MLLLNIMFLSKKFIQFFLSLSDEIYDTRLPAAKMQMFLLSDKIVQIIRISGMIYLIFSRPHSDRSEALLNKIYMK